MAIFVVCSLFIFNNNWHHYIDSEWSDVEFFGLTIVFNVFQVIKGLIFQVVRNVISQAHVSTSEGLIAFTKLYLVN